MIVVNATERTAPVVGVERALKHLGYDVAFSDGGVVVDIDDRVNIVFDTLISPVLPDGKIYGKLATWITNYMSPAHTSSSMHLAVQTCAIGGNVMFSSLTEMYAFQAHTGISDASWLPLAADAINIYDRPSDVLDGDYSILGHPSVDIEIAMGNYKPARGYGRDMVHIIGTDMLYTTVPQSFYDAAAHQICPFIFPTEDLRYFNIVDGVNFVAIDKSSMVERFLEYRDDAFALANMGRSASAWVRGHRYIDRVQQILEMI